MKTKLILLCFLALSVITKAQWAAPAAANLTDVRDRVGIRLEESHPGYLLTPSMLLNKEDHLLQVF